MVDTGKTVKNDWHLLKKMISRKRCKFLWFQWSASQPPGEFASLSGYHLLQDLRAIRSDFLSLSFQKIECSLARFTPLGEHWEEEAIDEFEKLTECADSKPLVAKISIYVQTGISTCPKRHLHDTSNGKKLDIGLELVRKWYAVELPENEEEDGTVPDVLKDMATETDASLASIVNETKKSLEETAHTLFCLRLSEESIQCFLMSPRLSSKCWQYISWFLSAETAGVC